eukprot:779187_1
MANDYALIPCEICNNSFTIDEYMTHAASHQQPTDYNTGNMYGPMEGGQGPLPRPKDYKSPAPQSTITIEDYAILPDGTKYDYNNGDMYGAKTESKTNDSESN